MTSLYIKDARACRKYIQQLRKRPPTFLTTDELEDFVHWLERWEQHWVKRAAS